MICVKKKWKYQFDELVKFQQVYGHCLVPEKYSNNPSLGYWVTHQRRMMKDFLVGEKNGLTKEKIASLEKIGFVWTERDFRWYTMLEKLKVYVNERKMLEQQQENSTEIKEDKTVLQRKEDDDNNTIDDTEENVLNKSEWFTIPYHDVKNYELRLWIIVQRREYVNFQKQEEEEDKDEDSSSSTSIPCAMTQRRIDTLNSINFAWKTPLQILRETSSKTEPTADDWNKLFGKMREKGINSSVKAKQHWFEGENLINSVQKNEKISGNRRWTEDELLELWNMESDEDD